MERDEALALSSRSPEQPHVHSEFTVKSSSLCYGDLHNIWHGASSPIQGFPHPSPEPAGTVRIHKLEYNVSALNGTWRTYQLVEIEKQTVRAWFACHDSVNPEEELNKILRVSGSPYELYHGSTVNNSETAREGVLVINRYDWGCYDNRGVDEVGNCGTDGVFAIHGLGLVDYKAAKEQALEWKAQNLEEAMQPKFGVWLHIPGTEYLFGRFGYDEKQTATRSFLFFTESTYFMQTSFKGFSHPIRKEETPDELFIRHLNSGTYSSQNLPRTLEGTYFCTSEQLGFGMLDATRLRLLPKRSVQNMPKLENLTKRCIHPYLMETKEKTIPGFDLIRMESRIKSFLVGRCGEKVLLNDSEFISRVRQYMEYVLTEMLEVAGKTAIDNQHMNIVPVDLRLAASNDRDLLPLFKSCKMLWYRIEEMQCSQNHTRTETFILKWLSLSCEIHEMGLLKQQSGFTIKRLTLPTRSVSSAYKSLECNIPSRKKEKEKE